MKAPFDGVVAQRYLDRGVLVQPGTPVLRLAQDSSLRVQFRVPERDLGAVRQDVAFETTTVATGERVFPGRVRRVSGEVSRTDRTAIVEGELMELDDVLRPGMFAQVRVRLEELRNELLVPAQAVLDRVGVDGVRRVGVFVVELASGESGQEKDQERESTETTAATWIEVTTLGSADGLTAIEGEISMGDLVLTLGHTDLQDGSQVRVVQVQKEAGESDPTSERDVAALGATGAAH